jgi:hypothetical protein
MDDFSPRLPGPDRCACCGAVARFWCERCDLSLCCRDRICPECDSDEEVYPWTRPVVSLCSDNLSESLLPARLDSVSRGPLISGGRRPYWGFSRSVGRFERTNS